MRPCPRVAVSVVAAFGLLLSPAAVAESAAGIGTSASADIALTAKISHAPQHAAATPQAAKRYQNCKALQKRYPHGVGMPGAADRTSGKAVTTFKRSSALYTANKHLDRDKDRIACEKR